jgi:V/A-type H+-transporting ATPase subunit E
MEMDLSGVIEKIKQDGVKKAEEEAVRIITGAEEKAKRITERAEKKEEEIIEEAKTEAAKIRKTGEEAVRLAARDAVLSMKAGLVRFFDLIIKKEVSDSLSPEVLKEIIIRLVTHCYTKKDFDLEILLSEEDKEHLRGMLEKALQEEIRKGVTFYSVPTLKKGLRVGEKDKNLYYDFSDEAIAETLNYYLNKKVKEIIDIGLQDAK